MLFLLQAMALLPLLCRTSAEKLVIPHVDAMVAAMLVEYSNYTQYSGPTNAELAAAEAPLPHVNSRDINTPYWLENIAHQGISAFGPSGYSVYRNVKSFGARGDGINDDTAAINAAISAGGTCGRGCSSSTTTPVLVYFPAGTYLLSSPINQAYYTQLIGNPNNMPTLKPTAGFGGFAVIDADPYYTQNLNWGSTNVFYRQIRNFIIDTRNMASTASATGIHWPTAQATSIQNVVFMLSAAPDTKHIGLFIESGSAGALLDLTFNGGLKGAAFGNQQFTVRNLIFNNCVIAISHFWDWSWAYKSISINNCQVGIDISAGGSGAINTGSITLYDSSITNTPIGIRTAWSPSSVPATGDSLIIENVVLQNVPTAVQGPSGTLLAGSTGTMTIAGWGEGHKYVPNGPTTFSGSFTPNARPGGLLSGSKYYERSKPQYNDLPLSSFMSARSSGARGNGVTDDTTALQNAINAANSGGKVLFVDAGTYVVTGTIFIPANTKVVGEAYPVIMSSGAFFNNVNSPQPVVKVGRVGGFGVVEWSDMIVSTRGAQAGATLIEWNLASPGGSPSGMWDVHTRIGGFAGSNLQVAQCPTNAAVSANCMAAFMSMHVTPSASNLYMENNWFWTADHDIDSAANTQISVYSGRGLLIDSGNGNIWLSGVGSEHHQFYQYQFANTHSIYMAQAQTETPYYQPSPGATTPFSPVASLNDPNFAASCNGKSGNCAAAWGLRILASNSINIYGAGLYSFFSSYSTTCSNAGNGETCQNSIFSLEGGSNTISVYNLNTIGSISMVDLNGNSIAGFGANINAFPDTIAMFTI